MLLTLLYRDGEVWADVLALATTNAIFLPGGDRLHNLAHFNNLLWAKGDTESATLAPIFSDFYGKFLCHINAFFLAKCNL